MKQLRKVFGRGRTNWLLAVNRESKLPEGLAFDREDEDHWTIIVTRRMHKDELLYKLSQLAREWRTIGRFVRDE